MKEDTNTIATKQPEEAIKELNLWVIATTLQEAVGQRRVNNIEPKSTPFEDFNERIRNATEDFHIFATAVIDPNSEDLLNFEQISDILKQKQNENRATYKARMLEYETRFIELLKIRYGVEDFSPEAFALLQMHAVITGKQLNENVRERVGLALKDPLLLEREELRERISTALKADLPLDEKRRIATLATSNLNPLRDEFNTRSYPYELGRLLGATDMQQEVKSRNSFWKLFTRMFDDRYTPKQRMEAATVFIGADTGAFAQIEKLQANGTLEWIHDAMADNGYWDYEEYIDELQRDEIWVRHAHDGKVLEVSQNGRLNEVADTIIKMYEIPKRHINAYGKRRPIKFVGRGKTLESGSEKSGINDGEKSDDWNGITVIGENKEDVWVAWQHLIDTLIRTGCKDIHITKDGNDALTQTLFPEGIILYGNIIRNEQGELTREKWMVPFTNNGHNTVSDSSRKTIHDDLTFTTPSGMKKKIEVQAYLEEGHFDKEVWKTIADSVYKAKKQHRRTPAHPIAMIDKMLSSRYITFIQESILNSNGDSIDTLRRASVEQGMRSGAHRRVFPEGSAT